MPLLLRSTVGHQLSDMNISWLTRIAGHNLESCNCHITLYFCLPILYDIHVQLCNEPNLGGGGISLSPFPPPPI